MTFSRLLFVSGTLTVFSTLSLFAQTFGEVTGHIGDATGAAIPAAKVYLTNSATNAPSLNILSGAVRPGLPGTAAHANFGVVTGASGAMRQLQLGLKYSF